MAAVNVGLGARTMSGAAHALLITTHLLELFKTCFFEDLPVNLFEQQCRVRKHIFDVLIPDVWEGTSF